VTLRKQRQRNLPIQMDAQESQTLQHSEKGGVNWHLMLSAASLVKSGSFAKQAHFVDSMRAEVNHTIYKLANHTHPYKAIPGEAKVNNKK
jgi:hypothetical protein